MATSTREQLVAEQLGEALQRLGVAGVGVEVSGRTVRLFGTVDHGGERRAAVELVRETAPDYRLDDRLQVCQDGLDRDEALQIAAMQAFDAHDEMADQQVGVVVEGGVARLVGMVTRPRLIQDAVAMLSVIPGIVSVETGDLQASALLPAADSLATHLEAVLALDARLDGASLTVSVANGVAQLSGAVRAPSARLAALEVASAHPGVRQVIARVHVTGSDGGEDALIASAIRDKLPPGCHAWVTDGTAFLVGALAMEDVKLAEAVALAAAPRVVSLLQAQTI